MISTAQLEAIAQVANTEGHTIAAIRGRHRGPTMIIVAGIHGNEPAGVLAAQRVLPRLQEMRHELRGEIVLMRANTRALKSRVRYIDADLNRQWTSENVRSSDSGDGPEKSEVLEQGELLMALKEVVNRARGEIYFLDLHTTSAEGKPFATVGDTLRNRRFALTFPVTIVLGLEEQIDGTLLEYVNNLGAITLGFEAGQHDAVNSIDNHEAVIWNAIGAAGNFRPQDFAEFDHYRSELKRASGGSRVIEVRYRHAITPEDQFVMEPGYRNFQPIRRGQLLARDRKGEIKASETGLILMPLYQKLGDDGFFLAREVKRFWLHLSAVLRRLKIGHYMHILPGVRRDSRNENFLIINTRIARIMPLQIFHLLGFRRLRWNDNHLVVSRRAFDVDGPERFIL